jgi:hypothetical protein
MKILFVLMTAILMTFAAGAQNINSPKGHLNIGIKGGLNVFNIHNDDNTSYDPRLGLNLGVIGHIHLAQQWAIQPEIQFSSQGAKSTDGDQEIKLNYLNVPVLFQYMWDNGFRLQAGPQLGFLLSAKSEVDNNSTDIKDDIKPIDLGLGFGAGYIHPATGFGIDARYILGLSDISEGTGKSTNRGFQVGLFYIFGHSTKK